MAKLSPLRAIRIKCYDCCAYQKNEIKLCTVKRCALWPFRHGHRPLKDQLAETAAEVTKYYPHPPKEGGF